jgi:UDP-N-acetylmuramate dehydrogenase
VATLRSTKNFYLALPAIFNKMKVLENISIKQYNSFGINVYANLFAKFNSINELSELFEFNKRATSNEKRETLILGGGSNILFTKNYPGLILKRR